MSTQPFSHRKLFTQGRDVPSLVHVLKNRDGIDQRGLYDLDGSLHRGFFPSKLKGISNADLAILLTFMIPLSEVPKFVSDGVKIYLYENEHITAKKEYERDKHIKYLVDTFRTVLSVLPIETVRRAVDFLPRLQYPDAKQVLTEINAEGAIISCGFQAVAQAYGRVLGITDCLGNALFYHEAYQYGTIYGAEDKERVVCSLPAERYVVIGDSADDLGLFRAAKKRNPESVVIALHGRCDSLDAEADIISSSWADLSELLHYF